VRPSATRKTCIFAGLAAALFGLGACTDLQQIFSPTFLSALGFGDSVAVLPGEAPAVVLELVNGTDRVIEAKLTWRNSKKEIKELTRSLGVGKKYSEALICPIPEMTLGDVADLKAVGVIVRLGVGLSTDPYMEVEPFGILLQEGVNYDCGDVITFKVLPSSATLSGYQTFVFIEHSGMQTDTSTDPNETNTETEP
jgi:hypothetical protein